MTTRFPTIVAALSIAGLLGWMASTTRDDPAPSVRTPEALSDDGLQERSGGSEVPCAVPLAWRIARADPEFDRSVAEVTSIVREAAALWEDGTDRSLFTHDAEGGFPIRLVYDERQSQLAERERRRQSVDDLGVRLAMEREALLARSQTHASVTERYLDRIADLERRVSEHNESVRVWNESDDRSDQRWVAIESAGAELREEQEELEAERPSLDAERASLRGEEEELNEGMLEHERLASELAVAFAPTTVEAGEYREAVSRVDGRVDTVTREIRIYRFTNDADLRLIAAHELGHALGLGHVEVPGAVMSASASTEVAVDRIATSDVDLFMAVCPSG